MVMRFSLLLVFSTLLPAQPPLIPSDQLKVPKTEENFENAEQPQAMSLSSNALFGQKDKDGKIAAALQAKEKAPDLPASYLNVGRAQDSLLRFGDSIATYTDAIAKFPKDFRFLRLRGQRQISLRQFSIAIQDLQAAAKMVPDSFEASYYLGLAHFFSGDHVKAEAEFGRCESQQQKPLAKKSDLLGGKSCSSLKDDPEWRVALQYWRFLAMRRIGDTATAKKYLDDSVAGDLKIQSTKPFYEALLFFKGLRELGVVMAGANEGGRDFLTRSSAVATYLFTEGERSQACGIWARNAMDQNWDHLGVINAESEYWQNSKAACSLYGAPPKSQP